MAVVSRRLDPSELTIVATNYNTNTDPDQAIDTVLSPTYKWFDMGEDLTGQLHFLPVDFSTISMGVWSEEFSGAGGVFSSPLTLTLTFSARTVDSIFLDFDDKAFNFATQLRVRYFDSIDTELLNITVANSKLHMAYNTGSVDNVAKVEVQVLELNKVGSRAKVLEFNVGVIDDWALMISPSRIIQSKVEITYLTPFQEELPSTVTAPDTNTAVNKDQVANGILEADRKWFSFGSGPIGSGFSFISTDPDAREIGWWSSSLSDLNGEFTTPPVITLDYSSRLTLSVQIVGDEKVGVYPVDFTVKAFDGVTEVYSNTVVGNTLANWIDNLSGTSFASTKIELTINKISRPNTVARLVEFGTSAKDLFFDDTVVSINYLEELYYTDGNLPIGAVSTDEITIQLKDEDRRFDVQNPDSPVSQELKKNRRIKVWFGVDRAPGDTVWYPLGTFYSYNWKVKRQENIAQIIARDLLEVLRTTEYNINVQTDVTLYDAFENIFIDYGLSPSEYYIDPTFTSIIFPFLWFEKGSHRSALQKLARNSLANVTVDRDDKYIIENTQPTTEVKFKFSDSTNIFATDYPLGWVDQANQVQVQYRTYQYTTLQEVFNDTTVVSIPASTTIRQEIQYNNNAVRSDITVNLTAGPNITHSVVETYSWGVVIDFTNAGGVSEDITLLTIDGYYLQETSLKTVTASDPIEIADAGLINIPVTDLTLVQNETYASALATELLSRYGLQEQDIDMDTRGHVNLLPGSKIVANEKEYMLISQELSYAGGLESEVRGKIVKE